MYVHTTNVSLHGIFNATVEFRPGLNLISGENGTCKTQVLKQIKGGHGKDLNNAQVPAQRILAISPKRNSERKALQNVLNDFRRQNRNFDTVTNERIQANLDDSTFSNYASMSELFFALYEKKCRDGGEQRAHMKSVEAEFNSVIQSVFTDYEIRAVWDEQNGLPNVSLIKFGTEVPLTGLSSGEAEVFSLMLNLYVAAPRVDVILIDEPEIHLNWHLEERLFDYFLGFCEAQRKQLIVCTHSRVLFKERFLQCAQFFVWEGSQISVAREIPERQRSRIAGEAIDIIKLGDLNAKSVFVEDDAHVLTVRALCAHLGTERTIVALGNSPNVKSLFKLSLSEGGWPNAVFVVDGDNEGSAHPGHGNYIHLDRYCIQNYWLQIDQLSELYDRTVDDIRELIAEAIKRNRHQILKKNKYFEFLVDRLSPADVTQESLASLDASELTDWVFTQLNTTRDEHISRMIENLDRQGGLAAVFPRPLIEALRAGV